MARKTKTPYDMLPLIPTICAETVASQPYTEQEFSEGLRSGDRAAKVEAKRIVMTPEDIREFADLAERHCQQAYEADAKWFLECVNAPGDRGRNQLYAWLSHWLAAYLHDPRIFRRNAGLPMDQRYV